MLLLHGIQRKILTTILKDRDRDFARKKGFNIELFTPSVIPSHFYVNDLINIKYMYLNRILQVF